MVLGTSPDPILVERQAILTRLGISDDPSLGIADLRDRGGDAAHVNKAVKTPDLAAVYSSRKLGLIGDYNGSTGTDNLAAWNLIHDQLPAGSIIVFTPGRYFFSGPFNVTKLFYIASGAAGLNGQTGVQFIFAAGSNGVQMNAPVGWKLSGFNLHSLSTVGGSDIGFLAAGTNTGYGMLKRLVVENFGSHGVNFKAGGAVGGGNLNNSLLEAVRAYGNRGDGVRFEGTDCNAIKALGLDVVANYGWGVNCEGTARVVVIAAHADQQYNGSPGAYRDNGNSNVWDHPYSEGGMKLRFDTGSVYGYVTTGQYGEPVVEDLSVSQSNTHYSTVSGFGRSLAITGSGTTPTRFQFTVDNYAASALAIAHQSGPGGGAKNVAVYQRNTDTWTLFAKANPSTDGTLDLGSSGNRWRNVYTQAIIQVPSAQTLAASGAVTINAASGDASITLQANATSSSITNPITGQKMIITWIQDATGGRTYVWPANCKFAGGTAPADTTAGKQTSVLFQYDGTNWNEISRVVAVG